MAGRGTESVGFKLANILRARMAAGKYKRRFPTENELMNEFGMSRYAVRSAMQRLEQDGQIARQPGRGTSVLQYTPEMAGWAIRTVEDLIDRNLLERPTILSAQAVPAREHPEIAKLFKLGHRDRVFRIERLSHSSQTGTPFFSINFLPVEVGLALPRGRKSGDPLVVQIERVRKIRAHRVRQDISGGRASETIARHLGLQPSDPMVVVRRTYYGWDGEVIVLGDLYYPLEGFRQAIDLFRANSSI